MGVAIPHYCYHPKLSIAGNCRMCMVEIEKMPKLQIACNTQVAEGMGILTQSPKVLAVRKAVLEFLLINHPVDCPICDQAGECWLQDYYMQHDRQESRFEVGKVHDRKRTIFGPNVVFDGERCIKCTRCVRFLPGNHQDRRTDRGQPQRSFDDRSILRRDSRQSAVGQRRRHLPGRRAHRSRFPFQGQGLVSEKDAVDLSRAAAPAAISASRPIRIASRALSRA